MSDQRRFVRFGTPLLGATLLAVLAVSCKDNPSEPTKVVAANTTLTVTPTTAQAVSGTTFSFPGNAGALASDQAGQNLSLAMSGNGTTTTTSGSVTNSAGATIGTFTAATSFGSCIFAITASTFPAGSKLALGNTITVNPCNLNVGTAGAVANGVAQSRSVSLLLGSAASANASVTVSVNPGGQLTLNGTSVGTVTLTPISG